MGVVLSVVAAVGAIAAMFQKQQGRTASAIIAARPSDRRKRMKALGLDPNGVYFPLIGQSGSGKSDFVNAARGLREPGDPDWARTGSVETTTERHIYHWMTTETGIKVYLVDLPGCGTSRFPASNYVQQFNLEMYDAPLLFCTTRVPDEIVTVAQVLHKTNTPTFFVRNKISQDLLNAEADGIAPETVIANARKELDKELKKRVPSAKRGYVIDSREIRNIDSHPDELKLADSIQLLKDIETFYRAQKV